MSAPPGTRTRSLGSSLLDQVLAETLDPAYAEAARERAARGPVPPGRGRRGQLLVAAVLVVVGLLGAVTWLEAADDADGRQQVRRALIEEVVAESENSDALAVQLEELRRDVARARDAALAATGEGQQALQELAAAEQGAAVLPVTGPGFLVVLSDAPADPGSDPVGSPSEDDLLGRVQGRDLRLAVNALWAAGAEALAVNGQRLGATTAIGLAGETVLVDFRPITSPYTITAIGDVPTLQERFVNSPEAAALVDVSLTYGVGFDIARDDEVQLPAGAGAELRSAEPLATRSRAGAGALDTAPPTTRPGG